jgi:hypothetical protein
MSALPDAPGVPLAAVPGLAWDAAGGLVLEGPALALFDALDRAFLALAFALGAEPIAFVPLLAADDLRRVDYFSSFPHLVTMPVAIGDDPEALRAFARANAAVWSGPLTLGPLAPAQAVLAPAACYAVYPAAAAAAAGAPLAVGGRILTTVGTCFRREAAYVPLRRQWCFRMREVVAIGTYSEVRAFLARAEAAALALAAAWGVRPTLAVATDPFFDPARSPKYLHQRLFPSKRELVLGGVALGSLNEHRNFFGEAFGLEAGGAAAFTGCLAFGLERWLWAIVQTHGPDPAAWPTTLAPVARGPGCAPG